MSDYRWRDLYSGVIIPDGDSWKVMSNDDAVTHLLGERVEPDNAAMGMLKALIEISRDTERYGPIISLTVDAKVLVAFINKKVEEAQCRSSS